MSKLYKPIPKYIMHLMHLGVIMAFGFAGFFLSIIFTTNLYICMSMTVFGILLGTWLIKAKKL